MTADMSFRALLFGFLCVASATSAGAKTDADNGRRSVELAFTSIAFGQISREDAQIVVQTWKERITEFFDTDIDGRVVIYDSTEDAVRAVEAGRAMAITLFTFDFLAQQQNADLTPAIVGVFADGHTTEKYVVVVRVGTSTQNLADLRDTQIRIGTPAENRLPLIWLDVALQQQGLTSGRQHARMQQAESSASAILAVFFGQVQACIVTERALQTQGELNPQIARELTVIARSPGLLPTVVSFGPACDDSTRVLMLAATTTLHQRPLGRQVLELFGLSRIRAFRDTDVQATRELVAAYERWQQLSSTATP